MFGIVTYTMGVWFSLGPFLDLDLLEFLEDDLLELDLDLSLSLDLCLSESFLDLLRELSFESRLLDLSWLSDLDLLRDLDLDSEAFCICFLSPLVSSFIDS